ncbi:MAG: sugar porter family MFS transporter [Solirubrobacteraceae bacterium]|nr:sugar porter family MFS transporter [Patulibacter sp.]
MSSSAAADHPASAPTKGVTGLAIIAALGGLLFGFDSSVINGATGAIKSTFDPGSFLQGTAVASALLGSAVGAWFAGGIADRFGRPPTMVVTAFLFAISAIGSAVSFSIWDLIVWRVIGGIAIGSASVIAPAYIGEISPARLRGRLGSLQQLAIVLGIFVALLSDYELAHLAGGADHELALGIDAWRWMFLVGIIPATLYGALALRLPESPRHLVVAGKREEAEAQLRKYVGGDVDHRLDEIQRTVETERKTTFSDLLGGRFGFLPIVWVGIAVSVFQQFVGINVIFYYSTQLWSSVGFSESDSLLIGVITSVTNIVTTIVGIAVIDRIGRRRLLMIGSTGMTIALAAMAIMFAGAVVHGDAVSLEGWRGTVALVAANVFVFSFGCSWGPAVWVLLGEMFPNRIRTYALAVAAAAQWIANFAVTQTFPVLSDLGLQFAYGLYAIFALLSGLFVWKALQETNGRELEDMGDGAVVTVAGSGTAAPAR